MDRRAAGNRSGRARCGRGWVVGLAWLLAACGHAPEGPPPPAPAPRDGTIRSAATCAPCHPHETAGWELSAHARHGIARNTPPGGADAAVGARWMQAYLRRDALGLHRIVPTCYDLREGRWRDVPEVLAEISGRGTAPGGTQALAQRSFDTGCSGCHASGTALTGGQGTVAVTASWRTLGLDCFVCHGPAAGHEEGGSGVMPRLQDLSPRGRTMVCGRCHGGPPPDGDLAPEEAEGFVAALGDHPGLDAAGNALGQIYQLASFLRSPCHLEGGLTCTDCHDAHGGTEPAAARGDALCTGCHEQHAQVAHTHHPVGDAGVRCIDCHMPRLLSGLMRHQREHRIHVPQPWHDVAHDACTACHADRDKAWARRAWSAWWGPAPEATLAAVRTVAAARRGVEGLQPALRALGTHPDPLFRAVAVQHLGTVAGVESDPVPEVRLCAAQSAAQGDAGGELLHALLADPLPRIRGEAAVQLALRGVTLSAAGLADVAAVARLARHHVDARRVLATAAAAAGRWSDAEAELTELVGLEPTDLGLWAALAETFQQRLDLERTQHTLDRAVTVLLAVGGAGRQAEAYVAQEVERHVARGKARLAAALLESAARQWPAAAARERFQGLLGRVRRGS